MPINRVDDSLSNIRSRLDTLDSAGTRINTLSTSIFSTATHGKVIDIQTSTAL